WKRPSLLGKGGPRVYACVSDWGRQRFETRECAGEGGPGSWRERCASCACLASRAIARYAANPWHVIHRAPGRKRRSREPQINSGRVESDRCFGRPGLTGCRGPNRKSKLNFETVREQAKRRQLSSVYSCVLGGRSRSNSRSWRYVGSRTNIDYSGGGVRPCIRH